MSAITGWQGPMRRTFSLIPRRLMRFEDRRRPSGGVAVGWFPDGWGLGPMDACVTVWGEDRYRMAIPGLTVRLGGVRRAGEVDHSGEMDLVARRAFFHGATFGMICMLVVEWLIRWMKG